MSPETEVVAMLRGQVADIISGTVFSFIGFAACAIAALRRRRGMRVFIWLGIWSGMYGARLLAQSPAVFQILPHWLQLSVPYGNVVTTYLLLVFATLAWLELSLGKMRTLLKAIVAAGLAIGLAGIGWFVVTGSDSAWMLPNNLLASCSLLVLVTVVAVPSLSEKFLILHGHRVLVAGTLFFAIEALYVNLSRPLHYETLPILDSLGFAALLFSFGYVAVQMIFASERRLLSIENELEIARQLQSSILPTSVPEVNDLRISATYQPMSAVAGDFYEFLPVDQYRAGFLIADVSGHGVPAALIASMIKVAAQSVTDWAHDPAELLRRLGGILSGQLRGQPRSTSRRTRRRGLSFSHAGAG
jgi:phosphoserine phosphatase RsbU/P